MGGGRFIRISALVMGALMSPVPVSGADLNDNKLVIRGEPAQARLVVVQSPQARNSAGITLNGPDALSDRRTWLRDTSSVLRPNVLTQQGAGHLLEITIAGQENQIAVAQSGLAASVRIDVSGQQNMTAVQQYGWADTASVRQAGFRNTVAISQ